MAMSGRGQTVAIGLIDAAAAGNGLQLPGCVLAAARQRIGADALVFQQFGEYGFCFRQSLFARLADNGRQAIAVAAPVIPETRLADRDRLQASDDLLLSTQEPQQLRVVVGFDELQLTAR